MDIGYWRYELQPRRRLNARSSPATRRGALIRVDGGYADVHPWPELGDEPLDEQLAKLARGETTPLTRASLRLAHLDGEAREQGRSLFEGLEVPQSHWPFAGGVSVPRDFDTVKVKMGPDDADVESLRVLAGFRIRLDFNATLDRSGFLRFINNLPPDVRESIEFVEDPTDYDGALWTELRNRTGVRLALDRGVAEEGVDVLVVKPAIQWPEAALETGKDVVITAYMDHPVGQVGAAYFAALHAKRVDRCGLLTHTLYEPSEFSEQLRIENARLVPPGGTGIGFDDLLAKLPWMKLT